MKKNTQHLFIILILIGTFGGMLACAGLPGSAPAQPAQQATEAPTETLASMNPAPAMQLPTLAPLIPSQPASTPTPTDSQVLWTTNAMDHTVLAIDSGSLEILDSISLGGAPGALAVDDDAVWVIDQDNSSVARIDPQSRQMVATIPIEGFKLLAIASGEGSVWVGAEDTLETSVDATNQSPLGGVLRIDPVKNEVVHYIETGAPVSDFAVVPGAVWIVIDGAGFTHVSQLDPRTDVVTSDGEYAIWEKHTRIAANNAGVWIINEIAEENLYLIDPASKALINSADLTRVPGKPVDVTVNNSTVWVSFNNGTVARIDPSTFQVFSIIPVSLFPDSMFIQAGALWVSSQAEAALYRVDLAQNRVLGEAATGSQMPTPSPVPSATKPIWDACKDTYQTRLHIGDEASVATNPWMNNRVREKPSTEGKVIGYLAPGERMRILEGPVCANKWVWWKVRSLKTGLEGWTSEGDKDKYWLVPATPQAP